MAKKVRKPRSKSPRTYGGARSTAQAPATPASSKATPTASSKPAAKAAAPKSGQPVDFAGEYAYVIKDLRRLFILAGVMLLLLIALNFIVQ